MDPSKLEKQYQKRQAKKAKKEAKRALSEIKALEKKKARIEQAVENYASTSIEALWWRIRKMKKQTAKDERNGPFYICSLPFLLFFVLIAWLIGSFLGIECMENLAMPGVVLCLLPYLLILLLYYKRCKEMKDIECALNFRLKEMMDSHLLFDQDIYSVNQVSEEVLVYRHPSKKGKRYFYQEPKKGEFFPTWKQSDKMEKQPGTTIQLLTALEFEDFFPDKYEKTY